MKNLIFLLLFTLTGFVDIGFSQQRSAAPSNERTASVPIQLIENHYTDALVQNRHFRNPWTIHKKISAFALAGTVAATLVGSLGMNDAYFATTVIPVVGPFITIARIEGDPSAFYLPGGKPLLIASGITQSAFLVYFVTSLIGETNYRNRQRAAEFSMAPIINSDRVGLSMNLRF